MTGPQNRIAYLARLQEHVDQCHDQHRRTCGALCRRARQDHSLVVLRSSTVSRLQRIRSPSCSSISSRPTKSGPIALEKVEGNPNQEEQRPQPEKNAQRQSVVEPRSRCTRRTGMRPSRRRRSSCTFKPLTRPLSLDRAPESQLVGSGAPSPVDAQRPCPKTKTSSRTTVEESPFMANVHRAQREHPREAPFAVGPNRSENMPHRMLAQTVRETECEVECCSPGPARARPPSPRG